VLGGLAAKDAIAQILMDHIVWNEIRIQGVYVKGEAAYAKAIAFIETGTKSLLIAAPNESPCFGLSDISYTPPDRFFLIRM
jgi:hypothetical protein